MKEPQPQLLLDCHHGMYIPKLFLEQYSSRLVKELTAEEKRDLNHPEQEFYWDVWNTVIENSILLDDDDNFYYLCENDGDLWAVPEGKVLEDFIM